MSENKVFRCGAIVGQGHGDPAVCGQPNYGTDSWQCRDCAIAERDQLKAENDALHKDAERYRWLRDYHKPESEAPFICQQRLMFGKLYYAGPLVAGALDREVDSAMNKEVAHD